MCYKIDIINHHVALLPLIIENKFDFIVLFDFMLPVIEWMEIAIAPQDSANFFIDAAKSAIKLKEEVKTVRFNRFLRVDPCLNHQHSNIT